MASVQALVCASVHEAAWLERNLLERAATTGGLPRWNRTAGGEEAPGYLRLVSSGPAPGLSMVHEPGGGGEVFGPYLGGTRIRTAITGVHRMLPLPYTGGGGSVRDLGRIHGVDASDREPLAAAVRAVLDGDPDAVSAVLAGLAGMRDAASAKLDFERARVLEDERDAVSWLTSTQRVTVVGSGVQEVAGWSDGILVRFRIRSGRLCEWEQRRSAGSEAAPIIASTPTAWTGFTRANAELAARLTRPVR